MTRVSVVIPSYNAERTIERAVSSAFAQTVRPHEVIVVDDVSTDGSGAVLQRLQERWADLTVLRQPANAGPAAARNRGMEIATGEWVAFLDADDAWLPTKLQVQASWMRDHPECPLTGHLVGAVDDRTQALSPERDIEWVGPSRLLRGNPFVTSTVMVRADATVRFDPEQRFSEEYAVWLRMVCVDGARGAVIRRPLAIRHASDGSLSSHLIAMERAELSNFWVARRAGGISNLQWLAASVLSIAKFLRRAAMRAGR